MAQLEEVKKILRSLLVSAPVKVTVSSLNYDYKSLEGNYIPFRELGYNSLLHLLYSIPDVLRVNGSTFGAEVTLVITDKVAHVNDMVMKQKRPTKGKLARAGRKSIICEPSKLSPGGSKDFYYSKSCNTNVNNFGKCESRFNMSPSKCIKTPYALSPFPKQQLPKHLPTLTNHLYYQGKRSAPNSYNESVGQPVDEEHHPNFSSEQFDSKNSGVQATQIVEKQERVPSLSKHMPHKVLEQTSIVEDISEVRSKFQKLKLQKLKNKTVNNRRGETEDSESLNDCFGNTSSSAELDVGFLSYEMNSNKVPVEIQRKLKELIKLYPYGIQCRDLPSLYKRKYSECFDYQKYRFDRLISFCLYLNNIFYCEPETDYDYRLYDKDNIPMKKDRINKKSPSDNAKSNLRAKTVDVLKIKGEKSKDWEKYEYLIPQNAHNLGETLEINPLSEYPIGETIQIVISEIYNPCKFWIYRSDSSLNEVMNSMQHFYRENKTSLLIPEFLLEVGLYCVVNTLNEFQRALIVDLLHEVGGYIKVYLIDYGTLANLPKDKVWFLMKEYTSLPSQAVETTLAEIEPRDNDKWSEESILRFRDMVTSKQIFAKIVDVKDQVLSVHISVMKMPLKTLNDFLVEEGYAKYKAGYETKSNNKNEICPKENNPRKRLIERIRNKNHSISN